MSQQPITLHSQIECVKREIAFRERCYPRWVKEKRMSQQLADHELAAMRAVLATLQTLPLAQPGLGI